MTDLQIINNLQQRCKFQYIMEGETCTSISFHDEDSIFGGTIRKNTDKHEIINLLARLENLKYLNLRKCKLGNLPKMSFSKLKYLDISCNDLESVPEWLLQNPLKFLNLGANKLSQIPDLSGLPLEILKLHKNALRVLPSIGNQIKSLNLYLNQMDEIPKVVENLLHLEVFSFGVSKIKSLFDFTKTPHLRWLTLTVNQLEVLPESICSLSKLEGLQLAKNKLKYLPDNIGAMKNLKALTLYSNQISELPESFYKLKLEKLNLSINKLIDNKRAFDTFKHIKFISI